MKKGAFALLYSLAEAMNQQRTTEELFAISMEWLGRTWGFEAGVLRLLEGETLRLASSRGIGQGALEKIRMVGFDGSPAGRAASTGRPVIVEDTEACLEPFALAAKEAGLRCLASIPLKSRDRLVGTLCVGSFSKRALDAGQLEMLDAAGKLLGIAIERSEEFQTLSAERLQWETAVNSLDELISIHDTGLIIRKINPAVARYFGLPEEEIVGRHCHEIFHERGTQPLFCPAKKVVETLRPQHLDIETKEGKILHISAYPILEGGSLQGFVHIVRDVTEFRMLGEYAHQKEKLAALERLAAGIAHNVNNPLSYVVNYLFILKEKVKDENAGPLIEKIEDGVRRAKDVLHGLIDMSAPSREPFGTVDLRGSISRAVSFLSSEAEKVGVTMTSSFEGPSVVTASEKGIDEVLLNILTNAINAGASEVSMQGRGNDHDVLLLISDNGPGINKEHLRKVFEPYFSTRPRGTGLGLYTSYHIIKSFGGNIWCESAPGRGARFGIVLRRALPPEA
jgi:two-component system NtrC family sensor kinase